jgi:phosphate transport system permease protein
VARGAGEVAPLMLVGVAALAPELPFSLDFPEFGTNRSFMHLGYQIYEMGFKSPDAEASIPFVFTTTLLLIAIIVVLNVSAIRIRSRLRRRFRMA